MGVKTLKTHSVALTLFVSLKDWLNLGYLGKKYSGTERFGHK